ncbi:PP2C family protein-serine/threonine phosphatase [Kitasatospora kifunensis]|uniref:Serine phosphatase RsbU (Regulator of sigma subunit) n=1 Tax=Kitasatospora kifunensis TaxID=58351 RepID=A0A7W7R8M0_KITKI|nr:PP2C family protein-serine/threonine phosphatase [Kitasatospora kifunensis]MBB4927482.1 serine phosphatase RsbU (regulator of sigma subunit) [Kitasatospora kifunensis]
MASLSFQLPRYVRLAPWVLIAAGLTWNAFSPAEYWGDPLLAAAAVMAGTLLTFWDTVLVGATIMIGILVLTAQDGEVGNNSGYLELANTLLAVSIGVWLNRVIALHGRRLDKVQSVARAAQLAVLPSPPAAVGPLQVATSYSAAQTEALIGGDAYAVQETPFGVRLLIADVRGKGLKAVAAVSVLLGAFREYADQAPDLVALADSVEHSLLREVAHSDEELRLEGFITALLGEFDPQRSELRLLDCGHPGPYLLPAGTDLVRRLDASDPGLPLGMAALGGSRPAPERWPFAVGDTLLLVTDGVTEARNSAGEFYDPALRLATLQGRGAPQELVIAVTQDVEQWTGGPRDDDMALLALTHRLPSTG